MKNDTSKKHILILKCNVSFRYKNFNMYLFIFIICIFNELKCLSNIQNKLLSEL